MGKVVWTDDPKYPFYIEDSYRFSCFGEMGLPMSPELSKRLEEIDKFNAEQIAKQRDEEIIKGLE